MVAAGAESGGAARQRKPTVSVSAVDAAEATLGPKMVSPLNKDNYEKFVLPSPYAAHPYTWPAHLFFSAKFSVHRVLGLAYLFAYAAAWWLYVTDYARFAASPLPWALPLMGVVQSLTAVYYFRFLPKKVDPGYYSDKGTLNYAFITENIFYAMILMWQWVYMDARFFGPASAATAAASPPLVRGALALAEGVWTFLPYQLIRPFFPKTRFRDGLENDGNKTTDNAFFLYWGTVVTKAFYLWAKWYIGHYLNYLRFLGLLNGDERREIYRLLLFSAFATTISVFLHTLKFKGYIGPKTSFGIYMISYLLTFWSMVALRHIFVANAGLVAITAVAALLNRFGHHLVGDKRRDIPGHVWQVGTLALLYAARHGLVQLPKLEW